MHPLAAVRSFLRRPTRPRVPTGWATAAEVVVVAAYLLALAAAVGRMAAVRLLWFDEVFTVHLARFASPAELWRNLAAGADNNPPVIYLLTAAAVGVFGDAEWAVRLPAIAGAVLAGVCLYLFVRRRRGVPEGLLALAALGPTAPVWVYFLEARPYGLMVGLTALALLCWQRATDPETRRRRWLVGFAATTVVGIGTHYFFVVPAAGLATAEAVRTISRRRIDRPVFAGFAAAGLALAALYPLWGFGPREYAAGFWAKVKFTRAAVEDAYQGLYAKELTVPVVLALAAGAAAGAWGRNPSPGPSPKRGGEKDPAPPPLLGEGVGGRSYPPWEAVALVALAAGPVLGVYLGAKLVGGYTPRYTLPAVVGLAGLVALAVGRTAGSNRWGCLVAAAGFAVTGAAGQWTAGPNHYRAEAADLHATADFLDAHAPGGAVLSECPFTFARVWHYHPGRRFTPVYLADPPLARAHTKADTVDRGLAALNRATAVPVVGFDDVSRRLAAGQPTYLFGPRTGWVCGELEAREVRFEPVARRANGTLYRLRP